MKQYQIPQARAMAKIHGSVSIAFCSADPTARAVAATEIGDALVIRMFCETRDSGKRDADFFFFGSTVQSRVAGKTPTDSP